MKLSTCSAIVRIIFIVGILSNVYLAGSKIWMQKQTQGKSFAKSSELLVEGTPTTFDTPSPEKINVIQSHPRIMFRSSDVKSIQEKLRDPLYAQDYKTIKNDRTRFTGSCSQALVFALYKDLSLIHI